MKIRILSLIICLFSSQAPCGVKIVGFGSPQNKRSQERAQEDQCECSIRKKRSVDAQRFHLPSFLELLERASTAGSVFTVKAMLEMLRYWRGEKTKPPKLLSRSDGDFYYCADNDKKWYAEYAKLVSLIDLEMMSKEIIRDPKPVYEALQIAFRNAISAGHPVVMDLFIMDSCKLDKIGKAEFEICIHKSNIAGPHGQSNFFVGVVKRLLENRLFRADRREMYALSGIAENDYVAADMRDYCRNNK